MNLPIDFEVNQFLVLMGFKLGLKRLYEEECQKCEGFDINWNDYNECILKHVLIVPLYYS